MKYTAVIIDDEVHSRETTAMLIAQTSGDVEIVGEASNAAEGAKLVNRIHPDIIFLDIKMPGKNGIEMLEDIPRYSGEIIFLTAYDNYAVEAFKKGAMHYLLKPLDQDDLRVSLERVRAAAASKGSQGSWLSLTGSDGWTVVRKSDIIRCESDKNYTTIVTTTGDHVVSKTLKDVEQKLLRDGFYRVHASHLIHDLFVQQILKSDGGNVLMSNGDLIPISKGRKKDFFDWWLSRVDSI